MGFLDILFGEGPSTETLTLDTLTPEQQNALNILLGELGGARPGFQGDVNVDQSDISQLSLTGLENMFSDPNRQSDLSAQATQSLMQLLNFENSDAGIEDFFQTNIRDPALEEFQKSILPAISRDFGGANFFSSERAETDRNAQGELIDSLTRARSGLAFDARESDRNRALEALGLVPQTENLELNRLLALFDVGESVTGLEERNVERQFDQFVSESGIDQDRISQLLAGINTQSFENVVISDPGTQGIARPLIAAAGTALVGPIGGAIAGKIAGGIKPKPKPSTGTRIGG